MVPIVPNLIKYQMAIEARPIVRLLLERSSMDDTGCRIWQGALADNGYGRLGVRVGCDPWSLSAHRLSYMVFNGPIVDASVVDHICGVRACIEPTHLRLLSAATNSSIARSAYKTHCRNGHALTPENTHVWVRPETGNEHRACRICRYAAVVRHRARQRAAGLRRDNTPIGDELRQAALAAG